MNISEEAAKRIAEHLKAVENRLSAIPADERQDILQSVETHIYDALDRACNDVPSSAELEAVIAAMDPPESYVGEAVVEKKRNVLKPILYIVLALVVAGVAFLLSRRAPETSVEHAATRAPADGLQMRESEALRTGVLHAAISSSGNSDILLSDPVSQTWRNLTRGRLVKQGWGQPWEPVGSPDGKTVVLRIYRWIDNREMKTQVWLLDMESDRLTQIPGEYGFIYGFTWSPDSLRTTPDGMCRTRSS